MPQRVARAFYRRDPVTLAKALIGQRLVRVVEGRRLSGIIVETEAFEDGADGGTIRKGMLYGPGTVFVMNHRGHLYLNVGTDAAGKASCVMVRAALFGKELVEGPGKVSKRLGVTAALDGRPLGTDIDMRANDLARPVVQQTSTAPGAAKNSTVRFGTDPRWVDHVRQILSSP